MSISMAAATNNTPSRISASVASIRQTHRAVDKLCNERMTIEDEKRTDPLLRKLLNRQRKAIARAAASKPRTLSEAAELASAALLILDQSDGLFDPDWSEINVALRVCAFLASQELRT